MSQWMPATFCCRLPRARLIGLTQSRECSKRSARTRLPERTKVADDHVRDRRVEPCRRRASRQGILRQGKADQPDGLEGRPRGHADDHQPKTEVRRHELLGRTSDLCTTHETDLLKMVEFVFDL